MCLLMSQAMKSVYCFDPNKNLTVGNIAINIGSEYKCLRNVDLWHEEKNKHSWMRKRKNDVIIENQ